MSNVMNYRDHAGARSFARALGWFSIALGASELLAARPIRNELGAPVSPNVFKFYGLREIATGVAILASPTPNKVVWARVAGDILDLVTLAPTLSSDNAKRGNAIGAFAFVAGATVVDIICASLPSEPEQSDPTQAF